MDQANLQKEALPQKKASKKARVKKVTSVTMFNKMLVVPEVTSASEIQKQHRQIEKRTKSIQAGKIAQYPKPH